MMKAFVFPGQGAQFPGMGKDLYARSERAREMFEKANDILGFRITDIMFEGSAEDLKQTRVTQPAIFLHSTILAACLNELAAETSNAETSSNATAARFRPDMVAGHSLGEFSALCASGAVSFEDALKLVKIRAEQMQKCCEAHPGAMAAVIGLDTATVEAVCERVTNDLAAGSADEKTGSADEKTGSAAEQTKTNPGRIVIPANYNCDGQIVISGEAEAVRVACEAMKEAGAKRALPLPVSGAFHSPLMEDARAELAKAIDATPFATPICPIYQNVSAKAESDPAIIKANLLAQLTSPVRWTQSVKQMCADGATEFMEIGPGTVLQGLIKRINPEAAIIETGIAA